jgi:hypothetical protein
MSLDLNRILMYGCVDGSMTDTPQRRVLHVCDGIIAGQGDGPLAPEPFNLGFILASENAAAMDWVGAHFLGMDPEEIPIIRGAFSSFRWPLTQFASTEVAIRFEDRTYSVADFYKGRHLPQAKHIPPDGDLLFADRIACGNVELHQMKTLKYPENSSVASKDTISADAIGDKLNRSDAIVFGVLTAFTFPCAAALLFPDVLDWMKAHSF